MRLPQTSPALDILLYRDFLPTSSSPSQLRRTDYPQITSHGSSSSSSHNCTSITTHSCWTTDNDFQISNKCTREKGSTYVILMMIHTTRMRHGSFWKIISRKLCYHHVNLHLRKQNYFLEKRHPSSSIWFKAVRAPIHFKGLCWNNVNHNSNF